MTQATGSSRFYDIGWGVMTALILAGIVISIILAFIPTERERCLADGGAWHDAPGHGSDAGHCMKEDS